MQTTSSAALGPLNLNLNPLPTAAERKEIKSKCKSQINSFALVTFAVWLALLALATAARAGTHTWNGAGFFGNQTYLWSDPANWSPVGAPEPGETNVILIFPNDNSPKFTTNDIAGLNIATINFYGTNYEIHGLPAGNQLRLGGGAAGNSWTVFVAGGDCTFAKDCPLSLQTTGTVLVADKIFFENHATLSGPGGFTKSGPGFFFLFADTANTYAGATVVADGLLGLAHGRFSPSGIPATAIPGPLIVGGQPGFTIPTVRVLYDNQFSSSAPVTLLSPGEIMFWNTTNTFGSLTIQDGADLTTGPMGSEDDWPGLLKLNGNVTVTSSSGNNDAVIRGHVNLGSVQRTFNVQTNAELYLPAEIHGSSASAGITKTGGGVLVLAGANTYDGPTLIQAGKAWADNDISSLGSTANGTTVSAGATLVIEDDVLVSEALTLNGAPGVPSLEYPAGWTNTFAGPITLNGVCEVQVDDFASATLILSGNITGSGALRVTGGGVLELTGFGGNTFSGGLFVDAGTARLNKSASAPALSGPLVAGRTNNFNLSIDGVVFVSQINQIPNNVPVSVLWRGYLDGVAADTIGNVEIAGGTLKGQTFTVTGNVTNHASTVDGSIEKSVALSSGTHFFHCDTNSVLVVNGDLQGAGAAITKTGPGELQFTNANSYSGVTMVQGGMLRLKGNGRPGSSAAGTFIEAGSKLFLWNSSVTNETLTFDGAPTDGVNLETYGTNRWAGPIVLNVDAGIYLPHSLTLEGGISGSGGLNYHWFYGALTGTLELAGSSANTFTGDTVILGGDLRLNKSSGVAIPGNLSIGKLGGFCNVLLLHPNQIADSSAVAIEHGSWLQLNGNAETIGSLAGAGNVDLTAVTLIAGGNGNSTTFSGLIYGTGGFTKTGAGTLTLSGDNSYTGSTTVNGGTLLVNGLQQFSSVSVLSGAKLGGTGRVGNTVVNNTATISPGASPGALNTGNVLMGGSTAVAQIEINGTAPGIGYDQIKANGGVSFIGGTLQVLMNIGGSVSNQYVIVDNDGVDAVNGTFTGLPEGASITNQGAAFIITYHGGDGNDIALIQQSVGFVSEIISAQKQLNGRFAIAAIGAPNAAYRVEACTNLAPPVAWTWIGTAVANSSGNLSFSDVSAPQYPMRFFRLGFP